MTVWTYVLMTPAATPSAADTGDPLTYQSDHAGYATARLLEQFHHLPRMEALLMACVARLQPLEDLCWQLLQERYLFPINGAGPAEGVQLDGLGEILGESRADWSDAEYLAFLKVRILVNKSNGRIEDLLGILDGLPHEEGTIVAHEYFPSTIVLSACEVDYPWETFLRLRQAKTGGVRLFFIHSMEADDDTFACSGVYDTLVKSDTSGYGSVYDADYGGYNAGVFSS